MFKILNLHGGPSSGKSTMAAQVFAFLKRHDIMTELVGEFAKELIYAGSEAQLINQVYIMGNQYKKLKDLERYGATLAISDSPLLMQRIYCKGKAYENEIVPLLTKLDSEFSSINVFVKRVKKYQTFGRVHTEEESDYLSKEIWDSMEGNFHYVINGDTDGADKLAYDVLRIIDAELLKELDLPLDGSIK